MCVSLLVTYQLMLVAWEDFDSPKCKFELLWKRVGMKNWMENQLKCFNLI